MAKIKVIDAIMGAGKSSYARQMINDCPDQHYVYVTPFLDEVEKTITQCPTAHFVQPDNRGGKRKIEDFRDLIFEGRNISTTHVTFSNSTPQIVEYIRQGHYTLILDEVMDVLKDYNDIARNNHIRKGDIKLLMEKQIITTDQYDRVVWSGDSYDESQYTELEQCAKSENLFLINGCLVMWAFPRQIIEAFDEVYVLTYMFGGSILEPYLNYYAIPYELKSVQKIDDSYFLCEYRSDKNERSKYKPLIDILKNEKMNRYDNFSLSKTDYLRMDASKAKSQKAKNLKNKLSNYLKNICKAKMHDIMWTCPKDSENWLRGKGYSGRELTAGEEGLPYEERMEIKGEITCFVPCNARASNEYRHKHVLAYLCNIYVNPMIAEFFNRKNSVDGTKIEINNDAFALSMMLQWIWRSAIRSGEKVRIWVPSTRMRKLLMAWLDGEDVTLA